MMFLGFFRNFPMGVLLGFVAATVAYLFLDENYDQTWAKYFAYGISALVGLLAAGMALAGVLFNIWNQQEIERERRRKSFVAARSTLPLALSQLGTTSRRGIEICLAVNCGDRSFTDLSKELAVDPEVISTLTKVIEFADEQSGDRLSEIVRRHQMMVARIGRWGSHGPAPTAGERAKEAVNWAAQSNLIGDAFGFARGEEDHIPAELQDPAVEYQIYFVLGHMPTPKDHSELFDAILVFKEAGGSELL